jgi:hypothetical protein
MQAASAPTMIAAGGQSRRMPVAVPDLVGPAPVKMNTMRIATPLGYTSRPPRKVWPIVLVLGLLLGLGGGAAAVAWYGQGAPEPAAVVPPDAPAEVVAAPRDAAVVDETRDAPVRAIAPVTKLARVTFETEPRGATIKLPDGTHRGPTPVTIEWPVGAAEVLFEIHRGGYRKKPKPMVVNGNLTVRVELERLPRTNSGVLPNRGSATRGGSSDTGLMRPDDL